MAKPKTTKNDTLADYKLEFEDVPTRAEKIKLDKKKAKLDRQRAIIDQQNAEKAKRAKARAKAKRKKQGNVFTRLKNKIGAFIWV